MKYKKGFAAVLTFALLLCFIPIHSHASHEGIITITTTGADANRSYTAGEDYAVMSVEINWDNTRFNYYFGDIWDAENHCYIGTDGKEVGWNKTETSVSVTNHSNMELDVEVVFEKSDAAAFKSVTAEFDKEYARLESAVGKSVEEAPTETFTLTIDGVPDAECLEYTSLGTITVFVGGSVAEVIPLNLD